MANEKAAEVGDLGGVGYFEQYQPPHTQIAPRTQLFPSAGSLRPLRPHQERAIELLRESLASGHRRPMLQAPTGFGKTLTAAHIISRALARGKRVVFTVPTLSLIDQTVAAFEAEGLDAIGVIQGNHRRTDGTQPLQVASVQTQARRDWPEADLVLIDEAQIVFRSITEWMSDPVWRNVPFIGLSATPWTRGIGRHYDDLIVAGRPGYLINQGHLSSFKAFAPHIPDLSGVRTVAGDFHEVELAEAVNRGGLVGDIVANWRERGENRPTFVFGVNRAHGRHLCERFAEAGVPVEYIDGFTDLDAREAIFRRFRTGDVRVLVNVNTLTVGVDLDVRCIVDARPTKSEMRFVQTIGRGLRTAPDKDYLLIFDHAGNHLRLGTVVDIHHDSLDMGEPKKKDGERERSPRLPARCGSCFAILAAGAPVCQHCGTARRAATEVREVDGQLVALGSKESSVARHTLEQKADFYAELAHFARGRYPFGWIAHKFRERYGTWPNHPAIRCAPPRQPSVSTLNWIKSRQIAFARSRGNG